MCVKINLVLKIIGLAAWFKIKLIKLNWMRLNKRHLENKKILITNQEIYWTYLPKQYSKIKEFKTKIFS